MVRTRSKEDGGVERITRPGGNYGGGAMCQIMLDVCLCSGFEGLWAFGAPVTIQPYRVHSHAPGGLDEHTYITLP